MLKIGDIVKGKASSFQKNATEALEKAIVVDVVDVYDWDAYLFVIKHNLYKNLEKTIIKVDSDNVEKIGEYDGNTDTLILLKCPSKGGFTGYAKFYSHIGDEYIAEIYIPDDAFRTSSIKDNKCRCSKAKILNIYPVEKTPSAVNEERMYNNKIFNLAQKEYSLIHKDGSTQNVYYKFYTFIVGSVINDSDCRENRWYDYTGIYFYLNWEDAKNS